MKLNFSIFKNDYKEDGSNQPDYTILTSNKNDFGVFENKKIGGCWIKKMKDDKTYLSCSIDDEWKPKEVDPDSQIESKNSNQQYEFKF